VYAITKFIIVSLFFFVTGGFAVFFVLHKVPAIIQEQSAAALKRSNSVGQDSEATSSILARYKCFGNTIAWEIYAEDNFITAPTLLDYEREAVNYKKCVWNVGIKEYMPFPPLPGTLSQ
jgi:hypothetical protein